LRQNTKSGEMRLTSAVPRSENGRIGSCTVFGPWPRLQESLLTSEVYGGFFNALKKSMVAMLAALRGTD